MLNVPYISPRVPTWSRDPNRGFVRDQSWHFWPPKSRFTELPSAPVFQKRTMTGCARKVCDWSGGDSEALHFSVSLFYRRYRRHQSHAFSSPGKQGSAIRRAGFCGEVWGVADNDQSGPATLGAVSRGCFYVPRRVLSP